MLRLVANNIFHLSAEMTGSSRARPEAAVLLVLDAGSADEVQKSLHPGVS